MEAESAQLLAFLEGSAEWMRPGSLGISELEKALLGGGYPLPRLPQAWKQPLSRVERQREPAGADPGQTVSGTQPQRRGRGFCFQGRREGQRVIYKNKRERERRLPLQYLPRASTVYRNCTRATEDAQMRPARCLPGSPR